MSRTQGVEFRTLIADMMQNYDNGLNVLDHYKDKSVPELQQIQDESTLPYSVLLFNLLGDLNIGSMTRTACVSGAKKVYIFGRRKFDNRGLVGCNNYINIEKVNGFKGDTLEFDTVALLQLLDDNKLIPIYAEHGGEVIGRFNWVDRVAPIFDMGYTPCIVMGNENNGYPPEVIEVFKTIEHSFCVTIPQRGVMRSFNVGHALSAILIDMRKDMGWL
jgi:tRNA G18 (ribose-2'-O)-methylase SpoU